MKLRIHFDDLSVSYVTVFATTLMFNQAKGPNIDHGNAGTQRSLATFGVKKVFSCKSVHLDLSLRVLILSSSRSLAVRVSFAINPVMLVFVHTDIKIDF